jgi:hypothetical protein
VWRFRKFASALWPMQNEFLNHKHTGVQPRFSICRQYGGWSVVAFSPSLQAAIGPGI